MASAITEVWQVAYTDEPNLDLRLDNIMYEHLPQSRESWTVQAHLSGIRRALCYYYEQQQVAIGKEQPGRGSPLALPYQDLLLSPSEDVLVVCEGFITVRLMTKVAAYMYVTDLLRHIQSTSAPNCSTATVIGVRSTLE